MTSTSLPLVSQLVDPAFAAHSWADINRALESGDQAIRDELIRLRDAFVDQYLDDAPIDLDRAPARGPLIERLAYKFPRARIQNPIDYMRLRAV